MVKHATNKLEQECFKAVDNPLTLNSLKLISQTTWPNLEYIEITGQNNNFNNPIQNPNPIFNFSKLKSINLCNYHLTSGQSNIEQQILTKIIKQKQPQLQILNVRSCPVSGKELFNLNKNIGWNNLEQLIMGSQDVDSQDLNIGLSNICQYNFQNLKKLQMSTIDDYADNFNMDKKSIRHFKKSQWNHLTQLILCTSMLKQMIVTSNNKVQRYYLNANGNN